MARHLKITTLSAHVANNVTDGQTDGKTNVALAHP